MGERAPPAALAGRLGDEVRPVAYRLDLTVDPSRERFGGQVEIDVTLAGPRHEIDLHGRDLDVRRAEARIGGRIVAGRWRQRDPTGGATLTFPEDLPAGPVTLVFDYDAAFAQSPAGMFHLQVDGAWYSWTQFQSIDARAAFPSFDQPGFKTPFSITLHTPPGLMAVSNAPEISTTARDGGEVHRFAETPPLPTYLVAMMVGPFVSLAGEVPPTVQRARPLPLRIITTRQNAGKMAFALEGSKLIVRLLEDYFDGPFPFPKLDQVTTPILPGAMENPGADLYRDDLLIMDENAPVAQQREFGRIVAHELAHQWFGDLVTPEWWDDLWLNESFANTMGYFIGDAWRPALNIRSGVLVEGFEAMNTDALVAGRPIRQPIRSNDRIDSAFDSITYGKGGHVIAMISVYLGRDTFRDGVRRYIAAHRYGTATSADFFDALAEAANDPRIVTAMRSFVEQQGVPLLVFRRDGDRFTVSQLRYAPFSEVAPDTRWSIPMCVRRDRNRLCKLITERTEHFELKGDGPLVPNVWGTGYYRFELADRHWQALIRHANRLSGGEALALVDSLNASVLAGRGNVSELARLARKLVRHPDSYAADAADRAMSDLVRMGIVDAEGRRGWRDFRQRTYLKLLGEYGFDPRAGAYAHEPAERTQRRVQIVSALLGTAGAGHLRRQLRDATEAYLAGDHAALDPSWLAHALDLHLYFGNDKTARALVEQALSSEDPVFRPEALGAAARTGNKAIAAWLLDLDDPRLRPSERSDILDGVMARSSTRDEGYEWIVRHADSLLSGSGGLFFATRLPRAVGHFCSVARADRIASDLRPKLAATPGAVELERSIERVRNCGVLDKTLGMEISRGFAKLR
ncbi:M1 family metallopeptidase [Novosphingobium sp. H3SJ31-1]|uniref:Aminopeptidase n=1 Tax=Novosphingobium album (ex Liu et al. 2023) TaxID=3031130 RepID=A0ABT5WLL4_9SPHN|nr:M1 family metallopeptidase [Novosphingobium album (ex Liu et al. 2023)]